jgi:hypothetical protein
MILTSKEIERILKWAYAWDIEVGLSDEDKKIKKKLEEEIETPSLSKKR